MLPRTSEEEVRQSQASTGSQVSVKRLLQTRFGTAPGRLPMLRKLRKHRDTSTGPV